MTPPGKQWTEFSAILLCQIRVRRRGVNAKPHVTGLGTVSRPVGGILSTLRGGWGGHPSERSTWEWHPVGMPDGPSVPRFDLAPGGVYRAGRVTPVAGALLPHRFTLTCATPGGVAIGGLFSVALSFESPRLAVSQHPALWSPDLPRPDDGRLALLSAPAATTRPAHRLHHRPTTDD